MKPQDRTRRLLRSGLDAESKLIGIALCDYMAPDQGLAWPSVPTLVRDTGLGIRTVQRRLAAGVAAGWLTVREVPGEASAYAVEFPALPAGYEVEDHRPHPLSILFGEEFEDPGPLTHAEVVERAVRWLRGAHKCDVVFAEMVTALPVSPDAIGWRCFNSGWSVLVEAKVSRGDFRADRHKPIHSEPDNHPGQERWYLTPPGLVRAHEVPAGWGLAECGKRSVRVVVPSPRKVEDEMGCWTPLIAGRARADSRMLLAAIQRHQLGVEWRAEVARFAAYGSPTVGEAK